MQLMRLLKHNSQVVVLVALTICFVYWFQKFLPGGRFEGTTVSDKFVKEDKVYENTHNDVNAHNGEFSTTKRQNIRRPKPPVVRPGKPVIVNVNNLKKFKGLFVGKELYVPFSFLKKYYEVSGKFVQDHEREEGDPEVLHFEWLHVNRTLIDTRKLSFPNYQAQGRYLSFDHSDVSKRSRVKCISGIHEVPITTQWDPKGYFYPIQVAQFGLSHLSKFYMSGKHKPKQKTVKLRLLDNESYELPKDLFTIKVSFGSLLVGFTVKLLASDGQEYSLVYKTDNTTIERSKDRSTIVHGIGTTFIRESKTLIRDLQVDLVKGLSFVEGKKSGKTVNIKIKKLLQLIFNSVDHIESVTLMEEDHEGKFMAAADWFLRHQDVHGGWSVDVRRVLFKGMEADAGWYSAMGQGQAISLLSRVFQLTSDVKYLNAALAATKVFHRMSNNKGVRAMLFDKLPWYEEYPTNPPSFVLNGFIYSLFGLYDLSQTADAANSEEALQLFNDGFNTLEKALPLFDNGHGTFYDLRHISLPGRPPNRARWQYHRIHLEQLSALIDITNNKTLKEILANWTGYVSGILSRHN